MQPFNITILGCGSALPTLQHYATSQLVELRNKTFMVDCGEGTQVQLRKARVHFNKINAVFISHLHGDHCLGLIGMVSTFGMLGRTMPLHIYAHSDLEDMLNRWIDMFCHGLEYEVVFHAIEPDKAEVIYEDAGLTVSTIPLAHRVPCCGFLFSEKPSLPHLRRDMVDFYNIPISQRNNIKNGAGWTTPEGKVISNSLLTTPADKPRRYAFCSDTKYLPVLKETLKGVDVLYHEATYTNEDIKRAKMYNHSTAGQAATIARDANVGKLLLGHYSARYNGEKQLLEEARKVFDNTFLTNEMDIFRL